MRRPSIVLFALFATFLVVTVAPVSAADGDLVVGSENTTGSDFQNATTLKNMSVVGTGGSSRIVFNPGFYDGFEDEPNDAGVPDNWVESKSGTWAVSNSHALSGSQSLHWTHSNSDDSEVQPNFQPLSTPDTETVEVSIKAVSGQPTIQLKEDGNNLLEVGIQDGNLGYYNGAWTTISTDANPGEWVEIKLTPQPSSNEIEIVWSEPDGASGTTTASTQTNINQGYDQTVLGGYGTGEAFFDEFSIKDTQNENAQYISGVHTVTDPSEGRVNLTLSNASADVTWQANVSGSWTNVTSSTYTAGGTKSDDLSTTNADEWRVRVDFQKTGENPTGELSRDAVYFPVSTPNISAGTASPTGGETIRTSTPTLSVDVSDEDFGTAQGDELTLTWRVNGTVVDTTTRTTNGTASITAPSLPDGNHTWSVTVDDSYGETVSSSSFSFEVQHAAPVADEANATPADGASLTQRDVSFEMPVSDADFQREGDTVNASLYVDGSHVASDLVSSNSTASVTTTISEGGTHSYYWILEDQFGYSTTTKSYDIQIPSELRIYNESAPTQLVDNSTVELRMYANESGDVQVYERNASGGVINMTGIPADKPFVVVASSDGYYNRRIFVPSLYDTQSIYLLPDNESVSDTIFQIDDYTGDYPSEDTVLLVQRPLNGSYQTVLGDYFGATGEFPGELASNERHRLVLYNVQTGEQRVAGTYTPLVSSTQTVVVTPKGVTTIAGEPPSVVLQPQVRRLPALDGASIAVTVRDGDLEISDWTATASLENNTSSTTIWTHTETGAGNQSTSLNLEGNHSKTLVVSVTWNTTSGVSATETFEIALSEAIGNDQSLLDGVNDLKQLSPEGNARDAFTGFIAMLVTVLVVGAVASIQPSPEIAGFTGVLMLTAFSVIGFGVTYDVVFVAAVGFMGFAAIRRGF